MNLPAKASNVGIAPCRALSGIGNVLLLSVPDIASQAVCGSCLPHPANESGEMQ
jgi:hypothetical protein